MIARKFVLILRYIFFAGLQILVLNVDFGEYIYPCVYLVLFFMPVKWLHRSELIWICFFVGFIIDIFEDTGGIHAFCCVLSGSIQNYKIRKRVRESFSFFNNVRRNGVVIDVFFPIFLHYFVLYCLDYMSIYSSIPQILEKSIINTAIIFIFVMLYLSVSKFLRRV